MLIQTYSALLLIHEGGGYSGALLPAEMDIEQDIVIVGAGISGLTASLALHRYKIYGLDFSPKTILLLCNILST